MFSHIIQQRPIYFVDKYVNFFWSQIFKIMIVSMTMAFYGLKMHQYMELIQMKNK